MAQEFMTNKAKGEKVTFKEVVLEHLRRIMKISSREFTKNDFERQFGNHIEIIKGSDNGINYIQAIENFAILLFPYFDKPMTEKYNELSKPLNCWSFEFGDTFGKDLIKKYKEKKSNLDSSTKAELLRGLKIKNAKLLFLELSKLLKRVDYLKSAIYEEEEETEEIIDIDEGEK